MTAAVIATYSAADQLRDIVRQLHDNETSVRSLAAGLTERQFHHRPEDGGWSIAQCIEHLELTGRAFLPLWDAAIVEAHTRRLHDDSPYAPNWFERLAIRQAEPPYKFRSKTKRTFEPVAIKPRRAVVEAYVATHADVVQRLHSAEGIDLAAVRVRSPYVSWMHYSVGFSFLLFTAHERRHLWQASRVKARVPLPHDSPITL